MSPFALLRRLRLAIVPALTLSVLLWASTTMADQPVGEPSKATERPATQQVATSSVPGSRGENAYWWFYLSALGLAVLVPVGVVLYRQFDEPGAAEPSRAQPSAQPESAAEPMVAEATSNEQQIQRAEESFFSTEEPAGGESTARMTLGQAGQGEWMCPDCGERFGPTVGVCPHDSTPLQKIDRESAGRLEDEGILERQRCPGCARRYEPGPAYCYHDGMRLRHDTVEKADEAPAFQVCETCGWEEQVDGRVCPKDGQELTTIAPAEEERMTPPVPMLVCPECGEFGDLGQTHCPKDETVLTPVSNAHARQLPPVGFGPRRKICRECGGTFSGAARYCSHDGSELVAMN